MDSGLPILWDLDFVFLFVMIAPCIRLRRNGYLPVAEWLSAYGGMVISATRKMKVTFRRGEKKFNKMKFAFANFFLNFAVGEISLAPRANFTFAKQKYHISPVEKYFTAKLSTVKLTALHIGRGTQCRATHSFFASRHLNTTAQTRSQVPWHGGIR